MGRVSVFLALILLFAPAAIAWQENPINPVSDPTRGDLNFPTSPKAHHVDEEGRITFKSQTILVQVPVIVSDKAGTHVHGLTKEDFEVLENGKEQHVSAFEEVVTSTAPLRSPEKRDGEIHNLVLDPEHPRSVTIVALDTVNTPFLDQAYGRKQLIKYLADTIDPNQVVALVMFTGGGLKIVHGLTSDPAVLIEALKKVRGELPLLQGDDLNAQAAAAAGNLPGGPGLSGSSFVTAPDSRGGINGQGTLEALEQFVERGDANIARYDQQRAIEATMRCFLQMAWSLNGVPGRKSLVWATGSFPFFMDSPAAVPGGNLTVLYERAMAALAEAQISIYPVDVRGLVNYSPATDVTLRSDRNLGSELQQRAWLQAESIGTLRDFAEMTGGRAFVNNNDLAAGFKRAAEDSTSYYIVGYYLDTKNDKAGWRKLKVKVKRPGAEVRSRSGFLVSNATMNPDATPRNDLSYAFSSPFDATGLPVSLIWREVTPSGAKKKVAFAVHLPATAFTINSADNNHYSIMVAAVAGQKGSPVDTLSKTLEGEMRPDLLEKMKTQGTRYQTSFELAPGQYEVRVVVRDNLSGRMGSVSTPLTVN